MRGFIELTIRGYDKIIHTGLPHSKQQTVTCCHSKLVSINLSDKSFFIFCAHICLTEPEIRRFDIPDHLKT